MSWFRSVGHIKHHRLVSLLRVWCLLYLPLTGAAALLLATGVKPNNHASASEVAEAPEQVRVQTLTTQTVS